MERFLWYQSPARVFEEALPLGNGSLGAMIYGKTEVETISLNSDTLWAGYPRDMSGSSSGFEAYQKAQELVKKGEISQAETLLEQEFNDLWTQPYLPLGTLNLSFGHTFVSDYKRSLDLSTAISQVSYCWEGNRYFREAFISKKEDCLVLRLTCSSPNALSFEISCESKLCVQNRIQNQLLITKGICPSHVYPVGHVPEGASPVIYSDADQEKGMCFTQAVKVCLKGGYLAVSEDRVEVRNAEEAILYLCVNTSFNGFDRHPFLEGKEHEMTCLSRIKALDFAQYQTIREAHEQDYAALEGRSSFTLETAAPPLPTDERLKQFDGTDLGLYELLFRYGKYLLLSSSREGTQASNLQGIWNEHLIPPWNSNYTVNINTEMNYWPVHMVNLSVCCHPLLELMEHVRVTGRKTAQSLYHAKGFVSHHNIDIWAHSLPVGLQTKGSALYAFWNLSSGWLCCQLFDYFEYTMDLDLLRDSIYPLMKEAAEFYLCILAEDEDGTLILTPSTSPENSYVWRGETFALAKTATMSMSIVRELFQRCIHSCQLLNCDFSFSERLSSVLPRLCPMKITADGRLMEWDRDYQETDRHHRHVSHLYSLFPGTDITPEKTPELAEACRHSLLARGDHGTGWSIGWKINLWARLKDGDHALCLLKRQLRYVDDYGESFQGGGTYLNLLDAHPPFQIDGNFGALSGICQMLIQSEIGNIQLLPALPSAWKTGSITGILAKGNIRVDLTWRDQKPVSLTLTSAICQDVTINWKSMVKKIKLLKNMPIKVL